MSVFCIGLREDIFVYIEITILKFFIIHWFIQISVLYLAEPMVAGALGKQMFGALFKYH